LFGSSAGVEEQERSPSFGKAALFFVGGGRLRGQAFETEDRSGSSPDASTTRQSAGR
jgi:hypothetical protein